jgi:hypothetical protein
MNQNKLFQNSSLQKAAEFSGVAGEFCCRLMFFFRFTACLPLLCADDAFLQAPLASPPTNFDLSATKKAA